VGETVAYLSHHIKNLLQGLRGGADAMEMSIRRENLEQVKGGWDILSRNLERVYHFMLNILAYSRERTPNRKLTDLNAVVHDAVELARHQAVAHGVEITEHLASGLPPVEIDPDGIHQVILNLVTNAVDAVEMHKGVINVRMSFDEEKQEAIVTVADNGPGIDSEDLRHIFEPFHSTKGQGGTGLGLAVSRKIVHEHNGRIDVSSMPDEGTIFRVRLPVGDARPAESEETFGPQR